MKKIRVDLLFLIFKIITWHIFEISSTFIYQQNDNELSLPSDAVKIKTVSKTECVLKCKHKQLGFHMWVDDDSKQLHCYGSKMSFLQNIVLDGSIPEKASNSCKVLKRMYPRSASGFYWIKLDVPTRVYCDMVTDGGGWMMVTNVSITVNADTWYSLEGDSSNLDNITSGRFIASTLMIAEVSKYIHVEQFRFFCHKPSVGRTVHISTKLNEVGLGFRDYIFGNAANWVGVYGACADILNVYGDDTSILSRACDHGLQYASSGITHPLDHRMNMHQIYTYGKNHISLSSVRKECDDMVSHYPQPTIGIWKFYVR